MKCLLHFICGGLIFGATALGIGYWLGNQDTLVQGGVAFALTLVPAAVTLAWVVFSYRSAPEMRLLASLGGSGVRLAAALGGGYFLTTTQPQSFDTPFWCWLLLFYLVLLGFEITLLVRQQPKLNGSPQA
jgi:hypothetical protein